MHEVQNNKTINSILIANRGEIASRIIRTCRNMGIKTIAIFSEADQSSPYVNEADLALFIGSPDPAESYLDQEKILALAKKTSADAIHPGYGFLAENPAFAKKCEREGFIFIGPNAKAIEIMGSKSKAKTLMQEIGVPVVPGYSGADQSSYRLKKEALSIGLPVLIKASAGGGGKGMRIVEKQEDLDNAIEAAKREAENAFGNKDMILEKYILAGRHIEFQVFGDKAGNVVHIFERECTVQRRYQKIIEESPSPALNDDLRAEMAEAALKAARVVNYDNAGTVEFIFDETTKAFYFLEMNTRLQVEHPVTEEITGLDLVKLQIESAEGRPLSISQNALKTRGYAIEARLYAEDPSNGYLPDTGTIHHLEFPETEGLRIEKSVETGNEVSIYYDPMIAKLIVWDDTRLSALRKMKYTLDNLVLFGFKTNAQLLKAIVDHPQFLEGNYTTSFIRDAIDLDSVSGKTKDQLMKSAIAAMVFEWRLRDEKRVLLRALPSGWRNNYCEPQRVVFIYGKDELEVRYMLNNDVFQVTMGTTVSEVVFHSLTGNKMALSVDKDFYSYNVFRQGSQFFIHNGATGTVVFGKKERFPSEKSEESKSSYQAPMPSKVIKIFVKKGQKVSKGDSLIVLSSMKMENTIIANESGEVEAVFAKENDTIKAGFTLLKILSDNQ